MPNIFVRFEDSESLEPPLLKSPLGFETSEEPPSTLVDLAVSFENRLLPPNLPVEFVTSFENRLLEGPGAAPSEPQRLDVSTPLPASAANGFVETFELLAGPLLFSN